MPKKTDAPVHDRPARDETVTPQLLREWALPTAEGSKYSRGQVVVVGGSARSPGAAGLAGEAALRVGAGRLTLAVARSVAPLIAVSLPECGVVPLEETHDAHVAGSGIDAVRRDAAQADAVLVGCGLDDAEETRLLVALLAGMVGKKTTVVLDAFALGVLADVQEEVEPLRGRLILTPNPDEAKRLADDDAEMSNSTLARIARSYGAVVSCQNVVVDSDGNSWTVGTGTIGLGTSGSGDVLAGAIAGLSARGASPAQAAVWGTYLHASAGDMLATTIGPLGFLARELLPTLPTLLDRLRPQ